MTTRLLPLILALAFPVLAQDPEPKKERPTRAPVPWESSKAVDGSWTAKPIRDRPVLPRVVPPSVEKRPEHIAGGPSNRGTIVPDAQPIAFESELETEPAPDPMLLELGLEPGITLAEARKALGKPRASLSGLIGGVYDAKYVFRHNRRDVALFFRNDGLVAVNID